RMKLRIGVVQFSQKIGQVQANLKKAQELTDRIEPGSIDLLCFPEMAFTGYNFEDASSVKPFLERPRVGPTSIFCSNLAKRLGCYVAAGYPELLESDNLKECVGSDQVVLEESEFADEERRKKPERRIVGANSAILFGPVGEWIGGYRKTNLFKTDKTWAAAGSGFTTFSLPPPLNSVTLAICMDLNPFPPTDWRLETGPYELADYCHGQNTDVLVLLNAWLDPDSEPDDEPSWSTLQYWAARLRPLWHRMSENDDKVHMSHGEKTTTVVICNRSGEENGVTYAGSSALFQMSRAHGKPKLMGMMSKEEEGIRVWTVQVDSDSSVQQI
ncbi:Protein N-terminal amidase, partial [Leucoagaricus sp. SymC.cos]